MLPALLFGAGAVLHGIYTVGQTLDSHRYWRDYQKNTGFRPKYPWRAGQYDYINSLGTTLTTAGFGYRSARTAYNKYRYRRYYR